MKKFFLVVALAAVSLATAQAQDRDFKAQKGSVTADFNLFSNGLLQTPFSLENASLKGRYFLQDDLALRLRVGVGLDSRKADKDQSPISDTDLTLGLGLEKHFAGTNRLSPYAGAELLFNTEGHVRAGNVKDPSSNTLGLAGIFGADYYVAPHFYLGVEGGLGLSYNTQDKASAIRLQTAVQGGFKVGFVF